MELKTQIEIIKEILMQLNNEISRLDNFSSDILGSVARLDFEEFLKFAKRKDAFLYEKVKNLKVITFNTREIKVKGSDSDLSVMRMFRGRFQDLLKEFSNSKIKIII